MLDYVRFHWWYPFIHTPRIECEVYVGLFQGPRKYESSGGSNLCLIFKINSRVERPNHDVWMLQKERMNRKVDCTFAFSNGIPCSCFYADYLEILVIFQRRILCFKWKSFRVKSHLQNYIMKKFGKLTNLKKNFSKKEFIFFRYFYCRNSWAFV